MHIFEDILRTVKTIDYDIKIKTNRKTEKSMENNLEENCELWGQNLAINEYNSKETQLFSIYRKLVLLLSVGITFRDILLNMNIHKVKIYGYGELGKLLVSNIKEEIEICAIYDRNAMNFSEESNFIFKNPNEIRNDGIPMIITPGGICRQISFELIQKGIERKSLIALNTILTYGMEYLKYGDLYQFPIMGEKQFLITGAQFHNKGAQAMLFTAVSEIHKQFPKANIWYLPVDVMHFNYSEQLQNKYKFIFLLDGSDLHTQLFEILPNLTAIIDVSGYALSSQWDVDWYMQILRMAYNYKIPLYLMPQSFGPFDFEERKNAELEKLLSYTKKIYAREKAGYDLLIQKYHLTNVEMSKDLVLQNRGLNYDCIYQQTSDIEVYTIPTEKNVGIIPNVRNYQFGNKRKVLYIYKVLIERLLELGKDIYIISHSDDKEACEDIYTMFYEVDKVHIYTEYMDCIQYCSYVKNFEYLIASRFHAIVHAYKENVPCIAIGWAEKYKELLNSFEQSRYVFDVREDIDITELCQSVIYMNEHFREEKKKLADILPNMQTENCFDFLKEL